TKMRLQKRRNISSPHFVRDDQSGIRHSEFVCPVTSQIRDCSTVFADNSSLVVNQNTRPPLASSASALRFSSRLGPDVTVSTRRLRVPYRCSYCPLAMYAW